VTDAAEPPAAAGGWPAVPALRIAMIALFAALACGVVGFGRLAGAASGRWQILFCVLLAVFLAGLIAHVTWRKPMPTPPSRRSR